MRPSHRLILILALAATASAPAWAVSSPIASASDSSSTSVGSVSDSFRKSSDSSSKDTRVADGDYRVVEIAQAADRPGRVRLTLQATDERDAENNFELFLPETVLQREPIAVGDTVRTRQRPYGLELAHGEKAQPFFLVLADEWMNELRARAVAL